MRFLTALVCLLLTAPLSAEKITFRADSMTGTAGGSKEEAWLSGNANLVTDTIEISADVIELSGKDYRYIKATGNVRGTNRESETEFTGGTLSYDRKTKIAVMQDNVHLTDRKNGTVADAELMEYNQKKKTVIMQIAITIKQKENTCTGAYALYHQDTKLLFLSGNPKVAQGTDTFHGQEITLDLDTQDVTIDGRVHGYVEKKGD